MIRLAALVASPHLASISAIPDTWTGGETFKLPAGVGAQRTWCVLHSLGVGLNNKKHASSDVTSERSDFTLGGIEGSRSRQEDSPGPGLERSSTSARSAMTRRSKARSARESAFLSYLTLVEFCCVLADFFASAAHAISSGPKSVFRHRPPVGLLARRSKLTYYL